MGGICKSPNVRGIPVTWLHTSSAYTTPDGVLERGREKDIEGKKDTQTNMEVVSG